MAGTIINTGPIDPYYHRDQADRAARAMALFVADRRRRKDDELATARTAAFEAAKGVADGSLPADSASVQARIARYKQLDPEGGSELEQKLMFHTDVRKGLGSVRKVQLNAAQEGRAEAIRAALLSLPEHLREPVLQLGGFTDQDLAEPKKPTIPLPGTWAEASMQGITGQRPWGEAQALMAVLMGKESKAKREAEEARAAAEAKARNDKVFGEEQELVTFEEQEKIRARHRRKTGGSGATKKEPTPEKPPKPVTAAAVSAAATKVKDEDLIALGVPKNAPPAEKDAGRRLAGLARTAISTDVANLIRDNFAKAIAEKRSLVEELAETEAELIQLKHLQ